MTMMMVMPKEKEETRTREHSSSLRSVVDGHGFEVRIRMYDNQADMEQVEELERNCGLGSADGATGTSLFTHVLMGDPLCRIRHYSSHCMMVAEAQFDSGDRRIVGIIRGGIKQVIRFGDEKRGGTTLTEASYVTCAYISGLRVARMYRRIGIAQKLVLEMESWCKRNGAKSSYIAIESENIASLNLFTLKLGYTKYRAPYILVQPIYRKTIPLRLDRIHIVKLGLDEAEHLYRAALGTTEFFPVDIDVVLRSPLNAGTWLAYYKQDKDDQDKAWVMLSLWRYDKLMKFEVKGASQRIKSLATLSRIAGKVFKPWVLPSIPNIFDTLFGIQLVYGLHVQMPRRSKEGGGTGAIPSIRRKAGKLLNTLCWHAHNMALQDDCKFLVTEVGTCDPFKESIPHWGKISDVDLWCTKSLLLGHDQPQQLPHDPNLFDGPSIFLDPRDF